GARRGIESALAQIRATPRGSLLDARPVGRAGLPSTVIGLIFHAAEHSQRHTGQVIATAKAVRASAP
ncbi:MAG TPA: DinB family protein, partial [Vicinamibacteria bacterium]|nr:DinB family protein [Vicinamibacteria bacterium]